MKPVLAAEAFNAKSVTPLRTTWCKEKNKFIIYLKKENLQRSESLWCIQRHVTNRLFFLLKRLQYLRCTTAIYRVNSGNTIVELFYVHVKQDFYSL